MDDATTAGLGRFGCAFFKAHVGRPATSCLAALRCCPGLRLLPTLTGCLVLPNVWLLQAAPATREQQCLARCHSAGAQADYVHQRIPWPLVPRRCTQPNAGAAPSTRSHAWPPLPAPFPQPPLAGLEGEESQDGELQAFGPLLPPWAERAAGAEASPAGSGGVDEDDQQHGDDVDEEEDGGARTHPHQGAAFGFTYSTEPGALVCFPPDLSNTGFSGGQGTQGGLWAGCSSAAVLDAVRKQ